MIYVTIRDMNYLPTFSKQIVCLSDKTFSKQIVCVSDKISYMSDSDKKTKYVCKLLITITVLCYWFLNIIYNIDV